jgi:hypothetical protein
VPANNPILGGKHITSYSNAPGVGNEPPAAAVFSAPAAQGYAVPVAVIVGFALLLLLAFRIWGFQALVSARVGSA